MSIHPDIPILWEDGAVYSYLENATRETLLVYSPISLLSIGQPPTMRSLNSEKIGIEKERLDTYLESQNVLPRQIIGFGSGRTLDIAKYLAAKSAAHLTLIPAIVSTNVFSTNKVALQKNGEYCTYQGKIADAVVIDQTLLLSSEFHWNLYGLADVLSFHTALQDWQIATAAGKDPISFGMYNLGYSLIETLLKNIETIIQPTKNNVNSIVRLVALSGYLTTLYGNGRPESGSEHIFARSLETKIRVPHGIAIGLGIALMSELQNNYSSEIKYAIHRLGVLDRIQEYGISKAFLVDHLVRLRPRSDRYSVIDEIHLSKMNASHIVNTVQNKYHLKLLDR